MSIKNYYRVMLGRKSIHAEECLNGQFIGVDFDIQQDLTKDLTDRFQDFSPWFRPVSYTHLTLPTTPYV